MFVTRLVFAAFLAALAACSPPAAPPTTPAAEERTAMERWQALDTEISKLRVFIQSRIELLQSGRVAVSESDRAGLAAALSALGEMESLWRSASADLLAGDVINAVEQGEIARSKARDALKLLGIDPGKP